MGVDPRLLEQVLAGLDDGITIQDREFRVMYQNPALATALGHVARESLGRKCHELYERNADVCDGCGVQQSFDTGAKTVVRREVDGVHGRKIWWDLTCFPLRDAAGAIVASVEVCHDVTARVTTELALAEQQRHVDSLLRLSRRLESATSCVEAVAAAAAEIRATVGYSESWVYEFSEDLKQAAILAGSGSRTAYVEGQADIRCRVIAADPMLAEVVRTRDAVVVEDARSDPRPPRDIVERLQVRTIVSLPVMVSDRHLGCLSTGTFGDEGVRPPTAAEKTFLMALAGHLAATLDRVRLQDEQRRTAASLRRLNRKLRAVSTCAQVLVRAADERALLDEICRVVCDEAGYRLAWVGFVDAAGGNALVPVAWAGPGSEEFAAARPVCSPDDGSPRGPAGEVVHEGRTVVVPDIAADPRLVAWHERARASGYRAGVMLPLKDAADAVFGVMIVCSGETEAVTADEIALLEELAGDLAYGLTTLRERQAQDAARRQIALLSAALNGVHEAAYIFDEDGGFTYVNDEACRALEYTREELLDLGVFDIDPAFPRDRWPAAIASLKRSGATTITSRHRTKGGREFPVEIHSSLLAHDGAEFNLALARDISRRQRLEEDLRQAQKLESIGLLAGGVAHDFNNMLAIILGSAEMAQSQVPPDQPVHALLQSIVRAAGHSAELTRQLLTFARRQVIAPRVFDLNAATSDLLRTLRRLAGEDIRVDFHPDAAPVAVNLDPVQLDQMLVNLCANARDAVVAGGVITLATRREAVVDATPGRRPECAPGPYAVLEVADDGHGMDPETRARVFEPFFTTKETGRGTGLGLATVYGIATQNGGFVRVDSEPGRGTRFRVYLPLAAPVSLAPATTRAAGPARGHETILFVEDDTAVLELTGRLLESCGYRVLTAATAVEAFRLAESARDGIDLLVTDVVMPGLNGCELAAALAARLPGLRCLYVSGYPADVIERQGLAPGGLRLLAKPFTLEALAGAVRSALDEQESAVRTVGP